MTIGIEKPPPMSGPPPENPPSKGVVLPFSREVWISFHQVLLTNAPAPASA
jgi:hypothetical protein